jgi:hypothetical protein
MNAHRHSSRSTRAAKPAKTTAGAMSAPVGTVSELARAWFANQDATAGTEGIGDWKALDRALIETPVKTREDAAVLLEVVIRDFRTQNENARGKLIFADNGQELLWTAINAAHRLLTADDAGEIHARVDFVAEVLNLDHDEVKKAITTEDGLLAFARRHHQSLDWLVEGDPRVMIARCAGD